MRIGSTLWLSWNNSCSERIKILLKNKRNFKMNHLPFTLIYFHNIPCLMIYLTCFRDSLQQSRERRIQNCYNLFNQSKTKPNKDYNVTVCLIVSPPVFLFSKQKLQKLVFEMNEIILKQTFNIMLLEPQLL